MQAQKKARTEKNEGQLAKKKGQLADIFSAGFDRQRILYDPGRLERLVDIVCPEKCNISTLAEVWDRFIKNMNVSYPNILEFRENPPENRVRKKITSMMTKMHSNL
jgi:hypothetical protein